MTELPLEASTTVELPLTLEQLAQLRPMFDLQLCHPGSQIWLGLASSYEPGIGGRLRIQMQLIDRKVAAKVIALLRKSDLCSPTNKKPK